MHPKLCRRGLTAVLPLLCLLLAACDPTLVTTVRMRSSAPWSPSCVEGSLTDVPGFEAPEAREGYWLLQVRRTTEPEGWYYAAVSRKNKDPKIIAIFHSRLLGAKPPDGETIARTQQKVVQYLRAVADHVRSRCVVPPNTVLDEECEVTTIGSRRDCRSLTDQ